MGAKTWMLVIADGDAREALKSAPALDRDATHALAHQLFPGETLELVDEGDLSWTNPPDGNLFIGCFPGVSVIAAIEFGIDYPSRLSGRFLDAAGKRNVTLHAMHSVVDWFAYAVWEQGRLIRALSLSPDSGIIENIGEPLPFERPFWAEEHRVDGSGEGDDDDEDPADAYPLPFHPLELGEAALRDRFGYQLEGTIDDTLLDPFSVKLLHFKRADTRSRAQAPVQAPPKPPWWKFW